MSMTLASIVIVGFGHISGDGPTDEKVANVLVVVNVAGEVRRNKRAASLEIVNDLRFGQRSSKCGIGEIDYGEMVGLCDDKGC